MLCCSRCGSSGIRLQSSILCITWANWRVIIETTSLLEGLQVWSISLCEECCIQILLEVQHAQKDLLKLGFVQSLLKIILAPIRFFITGPVQALGGFFYGLLFVSTFPFLYIIESLPMEKKIVAFRNREWEPRDQHRQLILENEGNRILQVIRGATQGQYFGEFRLPLQFTTANQGQCRRVDEHAHMEIRDTHFIMRLIGHNIEEPGLDYLWADKSALYTRTIEAIDLLLDMDQPYRKLTRWREIAMRKAGTGRFEK